MADNEIGSLHYDIGADDTQLGKALDRSDAKVKGFGGTLNKFGSNVQAGFRDAAKVLAVTGAGLTLFAKNATDFTVDFVKSSKTLGTQIGVSTKEASRLVAALGHMGIEAQDASTIFGIFSKNIVASTTNSKANELAVQKIQLQMQATKQAIADTTKEIRDNGDKTGDLNLKLKELHNTLATQENQLKQSADSFQKLGVSTVDASGKQKDFETILFDVADKFKAMPNGIDKTAIALDLFGRSGKSMIRVLNLGSDGIKALEKEADRLGLTLTDKTINSIYALVQSQKALKEQTDALKIRIGTATAPILTEFNKKLVEVTNTLLNAGGPMKDLTTNVLAFGGPVASGAAGLAGFLGNISSITPKVAMFVARLGLIGAIIGAVIGGIYLLIQAFGGWDKVMGLLNQDMKVLYNVGVGIGQTWTTQFLPVIQAVWNVFAVYLVPAAKMLWQALQDLWNAVRTQLGPSLGQLGQAFMQLWQIIAPVVIPIMKAQAAVIAGVLLAAIGALIGILYVLTKVLTFVVSVVSTVISWYAAYSSWTARVASNTAAAVQMIGGWFGRLPGYVASAVGGAISYVASLPGRILGALGSLANLLYGAGRSLIDGLRRGIVDSFAQVANAVKNVANGAVDTIRKFLGIHSPSTVFMGIGKNVTEGFIQGITNGTDLAVKAMNDLSSAVISPTIAASPLQAGADAAVNSGASNSYKYGDTNINIGTINDKQDADYLLNRIDNNTRIQQRGVSPQ